MPIVEELIKAFKSIEENSILIKDYQLALSSAIHDSIEKLEVMKKEFVLGMNPEKEHEGSSHSLKYNGKKYTFMCVSIEDEDSIQTNKLEEETHD